LVPRDRSSLADYPSVTDTCDAFAAAGFEVVALEPVRETYATSLRAFLEQVDTFRSADTTMRGLTDEEFRRGKERLRRAIGASAKSEPRSNWLDLLVLR